MPQLVPSFFINQVMFSLSLTNMAFYLTILGSTIFVSLIVLLYAPPMWRKICLTRNPKFKQEKERRWPVIHIKSVILGSSYIVYDKNMLSNGLVFTNNVLYHITPGIIGGPQWFTLPNGSRVFGVKISPTYVTTIQGNYYNRYMIDLYLGRAALGGPSYLLYIDRGNRYMLPVTGDFRIPISL